MNSSAQHGLWQKNPVLAWRDVDGQIVIISPNDSVMHELNETASFVWTHLDGRCSAADIARDLSAEYDVSLEEALHDIEVLLQDLSSRQLLAPAGRLDAVNLDQGEAR